ncbi:MAG: N4-gp56 family major capsid protein [Nanoarchaeota archaeon]|nr:N4-gp56 family major capsid protein [Nanoarchaeota archaeon]
MAHNYNDPLGGSASSIGAQARTDYYNKKALIAVRDKQYFLPLASVKGMPKHMGKKIKQDVYVPLLDERNVNDQGIDAAGTSLTAGTWSAWNAAGVLQGSTYATEALAITAAGAHGTVGENGQFLYGSSRDTGTILKKIPALTENGGRVNRVGFTRLQIEGELLKRGFFTEYSQESMDFDSDTELLSHITEEALVAANEMTEAELQADLLTTATANGTTYFMGGTTKITVDEVVTYTDLMNLSIALANNKTPKQTKIISGSRMVDTRTINGGYLLYTCSEMIPTFRAMKDLHNNPAFISVEKYADAGNAVLGEIGTIDQFRIIIVPEMQYSPGGGASAADTAGDGFNGTDIYPMLVVGDGAFTTIGFQTDGKSVKFVINHKAPGKEIANRDDPYGEIGFYSIKYYYGFMALRPERLGIIWTALENL